MHSPLQLQFLRQKKFCITIAFISILLSCHLKKKLAKQTSPVKLQRNPFTQEDIFILKSFQNKDLSGHDSTGPFMQFQRNYHDSPLHQTILAKQLPNLFISPRLPPTQGRSKHEVGLINPDPGQHVGPDSGCGHPGMGHTTPLSLPNLSVGTKNL